MTIRLILINKFNKEYRTYFEKIKTLYKPWFKNNFCAHLYISNISAIMIIDYYLIKFNEMGTKSIYMKAETIKILLVQDRTKCQQVPTLSKKIYYY